MIRYVASEPAPSSHPALFVDRDGVLNRRVVDGYVRNVEDFTFLELAVPAMMAAQAGGAYVVVVTNQGALGRRLMGEATLLRIHALLLDELALRGVRLDGIYSCPHHPKAPDAAMRQCTCRKPKPGLLWRAASDLNIDLRASVMIGDQRSDADAAEAAGLHPERALLVDDDDDPDVLADRVSAALAAGAGVRR